MHRITDIPDYLQTVLFRKGAFSFLAIYPQSILNIFFELPLIFWKHLVSISSGTMLKHFSLLPSGPYLGTYICYTLRDTVSLVPHFYKAYAATHVFISAIKWNISNLSHLQVQHNSFNAKDFALRCWKDPPVVHVSMRKISDAPSKSKINLLFAIICIRYHINISGCDFHGPCLQSAAHLPVAWHHLHLSSPKYIHNAGFTLNIRAVLKSASHHHHREVFNFCLNPECRERGKTYRGKCKCTSLIIGERQIRRRSRDFRYRGKRNFSVTTQCVSTICRYL